MDLNKRKKLLIAEKRLPFINIDNLEDPVGTMRDGGYGDPDVMDFPSGGNYRKGSDVLDKLIDLELVKKNRNNMMIAGGWIRPSGSGPMTDAEYMEGRRLIDSMPTGPAKELRQIRLFQQFLRSTV